MEKTTIADIEDRPDSATVTRPLTDAIDAINLALNYYELAPGDSFAFGYHMHEEQEEVFVIRSGAVTFETEAGDVRVEAGEVVRFAPGEYQRGVNEGDERVVAFAIGAPQDPGDSEIRRHCDTCGERTPNTVERSDDGDVVRTRCVECGSVTGRFE